MRNQLARVMRWLPRIKGKFRIGRFLQNRLTNYANPQECLVDVKMKCGSSMRLDLRTETESPTFWTGDYDYNEVSRIMQFLSPDAHVLDVGAHIGFWSIQLGQRLRAGAGRLFSFEPMPANFKRLAENINLNQLQNVIHAFNLALGNENGEVGMSRGEGTPDTTANSVMAKLDANQQFDARVRLARLDDAASEFQISKCDFVKLDIEGGELGFLMGARAFLQKTLPVIHMELNSRWMKHFGWDVAALKSVIDPLGYSAYRAIGRRLEPLTTDDCWLETAILFPSTESGERARKMLCSV